jgi:hypothetical protein
MKHPFLARLFQPVYVILSAEDDLYMSYSDAIKDDKPKTDRSREVYHCNWWSYK